MLQVNGSRSQTLNIRPLSWTPFPTLTVADVCANRLPSSFYTGITIQPLFYICNQKFTYTPQFLVVSDPKHEASLVFVLLHKSAIFYYKTTRYIIDQNV